MAFKSKKPSVPVKTLSVEEVPEVQALVDAQQDLRDFVDQNQEVIVEYLSYQDAVNSAAETAKATLRAMCSDLRDPQGISCGPVVFSHHVRKVDGGAAYEVLGPGIFNQAGGRTEQRVIYTLSPADLQRALSSGQIPKIPLEVFTSVTSYFKIVDASEDES